MQLPAEAVRTLREQHGVIARRQLLAYRTPGNTVGSWVARGALEAVERGVYRLPGAPRTRRQMVMAAVLRAGPSARAGGWTAAALHELEGFGLATRRWLVVPPGRRVNADHLVVQRVVIPSADHLTVDGIPALSAQRALVDSASRVTGRRLRVAVDDARRRDLLRLEDLLALAEGLPNHRGAAHIRALFGSGALDQDGEAERWLAVGLAAHGVYPLWSPEVLPGIHPDAVLPEAALVVECDGRATHSLPVDRAHDAGREGLLRHAGWEVMRVRGRALRHDLPGVVGRILACRAARMAAGSSMPPDWVPLSPGRRLRPGRVGRP